ncbi:hypothetical protein niasHT_009099 [Heterodera trifolii]|uniref:Uncharacterized protein n=1 Tax=Heterodera trifolii TaxID=157864 RepID=A0ABD2M5M6_9BILA
MPYFSRLVMITWIAFLLPAIWAIEFDLGGAGQPKIIRLNILLKTDPAKRHETEVNVKNSSDQKTAHNGTAVDGQRTSITYIGPHHHLVNPKIPDEAFHLQYPRRIKPSTQRPFLLPGPRPIWPTKNPNLSRPIPDEAFHRQYPRRIKPSTQRPFLFPGPRPIWPTKNPKQSLPGLEPGPRSAVLGNEHEQQRSAVPSQNDNLQYDQNEQQYADANRRADELQKQPQNEQQAAVFFAEW